MPRTLMTGGLAVMLFAVLTTIAAADTPAKPAAAPAASQASPTAHHPDEGKTGSSRPESVQDSMDYMSMVFVFMLATFLGIGIIRRVSRLLHTPLMSLTNAISAIAVVGALMLAGGKDYSFWYKLFGAIAMFASMTNIISGFLITDRMLKMFKTRQGGKA